MKICGLLPVLRARQAAKSARYAIKGKTVPLVSLSALKNSMQGEVLADRHRPSTRNIDFSHVVETIP